MEYKISNICSDLGIGKSTLYKRMGVLKKELPQTDWKKNDYFFYTENNKLFFTEKGFLYIKNFKSVPKDNKSHNINSVIVYQNQIIDMYKKQIDYLENENKRLLDIISLKEQKEFTKNIKYISNTEKLSLLDKFLNIFKK